MIKLARPFALCQFALFLYLAVAGPVAVGGCTGTDSIGSGGQEDASQTGSVDGPPVGTPGAGGTQGGKPETGGRDGSLRLVGCAEGPVTGDRCASFPAGKVCRLGESCLYGCSLDCSCRDGVWTCERVCRDCFEISKIDAGLPAPEQPPLVCSVFCDYEPRSIDALPPSEDGLGQGGQDGKDGLPGEGVARLSPRTYPYIDLGPIDLKTGGSATVQITNYGDIGTGPMTVFATAGLSVAGCGSPLAPGESCVLNITALPAAVGPFSGTVIISANPGTMTRVEISVRATVADSRG